MKINDTFQFFTTSSMSFISIIIVLKNHLLIACLIAFVFVVFVFLFLHFECDDVLNKVAFLIVITVLFFFYYRNYGAYKLAGDINRGAVVEGKLISDTSLSKSGGNVYSLLVDNGVIKDEGSIIPGRFFVQIYANNDKRGIAGERYRFYGLKKIGEGFYRADGHPDLIKDSFITKIRRAFLVCSEKHLMALNPRLISDDDYNAHICALKLFISRNSGEKDEISDLIKSVGLEYIFALSGMHLSLVAMLIRKVLEKFFTKPCSKFLTLLPVFLYYFLISRNPSFTRAFIMFALGLFLPPHLSLLASFVIQILLFPASCMQLGFDYSYLAMCGIYLLYKPLYMLISLYIDKFVAGYLSLSLSAVLFSSSVSLMNFGSFKLIGMIVSPFVGILASVILLLSCGLCVFEANFLLCYLLRIVYKVLKFVLENLGVLTFDCTKWAYLGIWIFVAGLFAWFLRTQVRERAIYRGILSQKRQHTRESKRLSSAGLSRIRL